MIDLNSPDNSTDKYGIPLVKLWRGVILTAVRDAALEAQAAYDNYIWAKSDYAMVVCDRANIDHSIVLSCFKKLNESESFRGFVFKKISGSKIRFAEPKNAKQPRGKKGVRHVQTNLL